MTREPWDPTTLPDLHGRTIAVTGATSGIGRFVAEQLAGAGAHVILLARDEARTATAVDSIAALVPDASLASIRLDLADPASVVEAAAALRAAGPVDVLVENAGLVLPDRRRVTTDAGLELTMATNHLGHAALAALVWPAMAPTGRLVVLGSMITTMLGFDIDDLQSERRYARMRAYAASKHAVQLHAVELDRRLRAAGSGRSVAIAHPGWAIDALTPRRPGLPDPGRPTRAGAWLLRFAAQGKDRGAWPVVRAAVDPGLPGGAFVGPARGGAGSPVVLDSLPRTSLDPALGARIWAETEALTGVAVPVD